tara:strand:- start:76 stop:408 length:333 start_codon:yes stop_codon:yes gene_type:complete
METSSSLIILALLMLLVIVAYSRTTFKYVESKKNNRNNLNNYNNSNNSSKETDSRVSSSRLSQSNSGGSKPTTLYGFPEKDAYMSQTLKEQIDNLESKFYYDNCQFEPIN